MYSLGLASTSAEQPVDFPDSENENEPRDYLEKRIKSNVIYALQTNSHQGNISTSLEEFNQSDITEHAGLISMTADKMNIDQLFPPVRDRVQQSAKRTLTPTAEWEGYVESISEGKFFVKMVNVRSNSPLPTDQATFSKDDISEHDQQLLKEGAIVRWIIGRERLPTGQIRKVSEIHFRRLPAFRMEDYRQALDKANVLLEEIVWDNDSQQG